MSRPQPNAVASRNILSRLRSSTAAEHERLETRLDLLRPDLTMADYTNLLARFYGFYLPWEEKAQPLLQRHAPLLYQGRSKINLLRNDLRRLGEKLEEIPLCNPDFLAQDFSHVLGSVYVLEGSTLGGQLLARHFKTHLQLAPQSMTFFAGYGEQTGSMWKAFSAQLQEVSSAADEDVMLHSARATFSFLENWMLAENRHGSA